MMILPLSPRSCCSTLAFAILFVLLSLAAAQNGELPAATASNCSAEITVNSTMPSHAFYIYHDIIVENTGLCSLSKVFVSITLPPGDTVFAYYNVSNSTGEILGLTTPMPQGRVEVGGTIVMNSARLPIITLSQVECSAVCNTASSPSTSGETPVDPPGSSEASSAETSSEDTSSDATPSDPSWSGFQVAVKKGSNPYWFALNVLSGGEVKGPGQVQFRDSSSDAAWLRMDSANWGDAPTFTFSPTSGLPLRLPISLRITFPDEKDIVILNDVITSFYPDTYSSQATREAPAEGIDA